MTKTKTPKPKLPRFLTVWSREGIRPGSHVAVGWRRPGDTRPRWASGELIGVARRKDDQAPFVAIRQHGGTTVTILAADIQRHIDASGGLPGSDSRRCVACGGWLSSFDRAASARPDMHFDCA